ncbi:hypothetical protein DL96DRAFT_1687761 [Flagelloscypha sp. PMI_526]|nr:hypothetical protein DL96DRAFT_1687761 [Flagelloscypha sp. PMI_526]
MGLGGKTTCGEPTIASLLSPITSTRRMEKKTGWAGHLGVVGEIPRKRGGGYTLVDVGRMEDLGSNERKAQDLELKFSTCSSSHMQSVGNGVVEGGVEQEVAAGSKQSRSAWAIQPPEPDQEVLFSLDSGQFENLSCPSQLFILRESLFTGIWDSSSSISGDNMIGSTKF